MTSESVLKNIIRELVQTGAYKDEQSALQAMAIEQVLKKIRNYRRTIKRLQRKYKVDDLKEFTCQIKNQANILQEDDWMEWKAAVEMLEGWEKTLCELTKSEL